MVVHPNPARKVNKENKELAEHCVFKSSLSNNYFFMNINVKNVDSFIELSSLDFSIDLYTIQSQCNMQIIDNIEHSL